MEVDHTVGMQRQWFTDPNGGFYRNLRLISDEIARTPWWRWRRQEALHEEWERCWAAGLIRVAELPPGDVVVARRTFREAYPGHPILWES